VNANFDLAPSRLQQLAAERNVKVETSETGYLIRITAVKDDALRAVDELELIARSIKTRSLPTYSLVPGETKEAREASVKALIDNDALIRRDDLEAISRLTRVDLTSNSVGLV
jgi:Mitochondrial inner-membrane-bound regulator